MSGDPKSHARLRQIAILVSCVDASTARQLLLHLPTEKAKQVRKLASQLGEISAEEKRKILSDFQRTAANASAASRSTTSGMQQPAAVDSNAGRPPAQNTGPQLESGGVASYEQDTLPEDDSSGPPWTKLSVDALLKFLREERPAIIAVVISQLDPARAVGVLQELPGVVNHEVLTRMSRLGEVDVEAMEAIDAHLSERLTEYQKTAQSEGQNRRRIEALLSAAPVALREQWQSVLAGDSGSQLSTSQATATQPAPMQAGYPQPAAQPVAQPQPPGSLAEIYQDSTLTTAQPNPYSPDWNPAVAAAANHLDTVDFHSNNPGSGIPLSSNGSPSGGAANREQIYAFGDEDGTAAAASGESAAATGHDAPSSTYTDRSLIQLEFEQLLDLPPALLAQVLSTPDANTVILALAGATPQFIEKFYDLLRHEDADALRARLRTIGPVQLRDMDEAQRRIVQLASELSQPAASAQPRTRQRQAA